MGRCSDLERGDDSDGDGARQPGPAVPRDVRRDAVAGGALPTASPEEPEPAEPEPDAAVGPEPSAAAQPPKRVASEKMKVALLRARTAKAENRRQRCQAAILAQQYFFDIVQLTAYDATTVPRHYILRCDAR
jgi:hypothetical protein